ncbi:MAG: 4-phosphoerythronate dehydrogenase [Bacteroidales bacterium]|nr:4-phosphoerythronate dehydrogenase [Bacteroidales bacterium]
MKIVCDNKVRFLGDVFHGIANVEYYPGSEIDKTKVKDADALLVRTRTQCNENLLSGSSVKFIGTATIGFDHIDTNYCEKNGIFWTNAPGCNSGSVCQYIISVLHCLSKYYGFLLNKKTIGIIGAGHVGSKVIKASKILGMNVLVNDPPLQKLGNKDYDFCDIDYLLKNSDIVDIHVPFNKDGEYSTNHLVNSEFISKMKKNSIIINSSRGPVADNLELLEALKHEKILTAVLDVWENEPKINIELLQRVFLATPHIAGYSVDGKANATMQIVRQLSKFFNLNLNNWTPSVKGYDGFMLNYDLITDYEQVIKSYNVLRDSEKLKTSPEKFEWFRENYPTRREQL